MTAAVDVPWPARDTPRNTRRTTGQYALGREQSSDTIEPFQLAIPEAELADLRSRLANTRWPERETVVDRSEGMPLADAQALCAYWRDSYDWRRCEARLNALGQFRTTIDGLGMHFLHVRSNEPDAIPLERRPPLPTRRFTPVDTDVTHCFI
ncbi:epoxide hydrolase N-terminal domain-containing protein [Novosphingobium barchaimii]|uniref:epoxide hydrolase N-terminal domain-containing protein n=1 Tax=Novosphingobium barchaimii TaxID=1420591 RepID=UPI0009E973A4|nr:epoxide hydrolase N-terminal domain-containing protein [Novosphingobium barchaimii]